ncbi:MAG: uroporphyrinogen decarboxylase family protein [Lachnospiraceae bacterium]|nr:uroporphyrinogen decarboxylase family protein [Lachnospiraceae bacterium]
MTSKERVLATMNFQPVDRPAVMPLEGTAWICRRAGISYADQYEMADYGAADIVKGFEDMKSDVVFCGGSCWMAWAHAFGSEVDATTVGGPVNVGPAFDPEKGIPEMTDDEIRETLLNDYYIKAMLGQIKAVKAIVGDDKPIMSGHCGPFTGASVLAGTKKFVKYVGKNNPILPALLDFTSRVLGIYADLMKDAGTDILNVCDPMASGDMVALDTFKDLDLPAMETYLKYKPELPYLVHICGNAGERVEFIRDFGAAFFSVDSMVDMADMIRKCDHKMVMVGNINPAGVMLQGTPEDVYNETKKLLEMAKENGGGIIPSTGCELPAASPLENILAMVKAAEDMGAIG